MEFFTNRQRANGFVAGFWYLHRCTSRWLCCCYAPTIPECIFGLFPIPIGGRNSCAPTNADWPVLGCQPFAGFALTPVANCVRCIFRPLAAIPLELKFRLQQQGRSCLNFIQPNLYSNPNCDSMVLKSKPLQQMI